MWLSSGVRVVGMGGGNAIINSSSRMGGKILKVVSKNNSIIGGSRAMSIVTAAMCGRRGQWWMASGVNNSSNNGNVMSSSTSSSLMYMRPLTTAAATTVALVGKKAPDFTAKAVFPDDTVSEIALSSFALQKKYVCLLFWPFDFTFVCPSEVLAFNQINDEFKSRNVELIGASVDSTHVHLAWRRTAIADGGIGRVTFPIISDITKSISSQYGILHDNSCALRGLFIIDSNGIIRHQLVNDLPIGRSATEALRIVDAVQHHQQFGEVCPANWKKGDPTMLENNSSVSQYLSNTFK